VNRILIVAGEASGDLHGSSLISEYAALHPETRFLGVGGERMAAAGCEILVPSEQVAVMGFVEVIRHFPEIWRAFQTLKRVLYGPERPQSLVLIDFPEFNLRLARHAQRAGVPVLYYVSPQVWAWRQGRVRKIARLVDALAAIFPFEPKLYAGLDIDVRYIGHPLLDEFASESGQRDLRSALEIEAGLPVVGLFPGSRRSELSAMLETLVVTARQIVLRKPEVRFVVPIAATLRSAGIAELLPDDLPVDLVDIRDISIYDIARGCDAVLTVSGTVTLQIALAGTPMAIFYKLAPLSYALGKRLVRVKHIGLVNIVAGKEIVPEFIQEQANPDRLSEAILGLLDDKAEQLRIREELAAVRQQLGEPGSAARVAGMLDQLVQSRQAQKV